VRRLAFDVAGAVGSFDIEARLETGEQPLVLVGPNGAGKTTLLLMLLGAIRPRRGRIALDGDVVFDSTQAIDVPTEDRGLGYVPQDYGLFPHMNVLANVTFAVACRSRVPAAQRRGRALELLGELEVAHLASRLPSSLSGGERQRVALARAMASEPRALLLDEPLAALDAAVRRQLREFLPSRLASLRLPAIVVTHDPADAAAFGDDIAVMEAGRVVQRGTFVELRARPASAFVAELSR